MDYLKDKATTTMYVISAADLKQFAEDLITSVIQRTRDKDNDILLTRQATAEMLDVTLPTLWRWEREERLLPIHIGRKVRYRKSEVRKILRERGNVNNSSKYWNNYD